MFLQKRGSPPSTISKDERKHAVEKIDRAFETMLHVKPQHPLTLQAAMLLQDLPQSRHLNRCKPDIMLYTGYLNAMSQLEDPAAAMQHILFCMYWELQVTPQQCSKPCVQQIWRECCCLPHCKPNNVGAQYLSFFACYQLNAIHVSNKQVLARNYS